MTLRVHFDGRVLVPEGPVDLPLGQSLEIEVKKPLAPPQYQPADAPFFEMKNGFPVFIVPPGTPQITSDDIKRHLEDEI